MPTRSGLRIVNETNLHAAAMIGGSNSNKTSSTVIDHNDVHPSLLMLVDEDGNMVPQHQDMMHKPGKTYVNLDSKHWQGGTTTVLEERTLPVVFQDMKREETDHMDAVTSSRAGRTRPGRKGARVVEDEDQSPEEQERLRIRRERNKEAAARCRKRKIDQIESLEKQVSEWESRNERLQKELVDLKQERDELQYLLQQHRTTCTTTASLATGYHSQQQQHDNSALDSACTILRVPTLPAAAATTVTLHSDNSNGSFADDVKSETSSVGVAGEDVFSVPEEYRYTSPEPVAAEELPTVAAFTPAVVTAKRTRISRPVSLNLPVKAQNLRSIEGVPIETPTNVFNSLNFDALMDGRTGLTPTNILTPVSITMSTLATPVLNSPTCSSQQRNNVTSHADKNLKLVSL